MTHKSVLLNEVLEYLDPKPRENFIDGTVGEGGHAKEILQKTGPTGKLLGMDWDLRQIENCKAALAEFGSRIILEHGSYVDMAKVAEEYGLRPINGILLDLGMSSWQLENSGKGFSFQKDEPLDMRYGAGELTAEKIVNEYGEQELEKIFSDYGEEKFARQIAKEIVRARLHQKIETTFALKNIIEVAVGWREKIHPATRVFQALRIAVNAELENIARGLQESLSILSPGGRMVVISFHSLEDRIVKNFFREQEKLGAIKILTKKPVTATGHEIAENRRARSAKLRAFVKK